MTPLDIVPVQLVCILFFILKEDAHPRLLVCVLQWVRILVADVLHRRVPINIVGNKDPHQSVVRSGVTPRLMIGLHSPPYGRGRHIFSSWIILRWRRGLATSLSGDGG
jgi:hypothetical protein